MNRSRLTAELIILFKGHIFNSLFQSRKDRRRKRGQVKVDVIGKYLGTLKPVICSVEEDPPLSDESEERIFSIWLQGEDNAPDIVRACYRSIRANCTQRLVVLDGTTIWDWIELPDHIVSKWKSGKIKPAHFADICRVELLYRYGGIWADATDFVTRPFPEWLLGEDFFIYLAGNDITGSYAFIQNCFFRARRHNYILKVWRAAIHEYWRREDSAIDYFIHQLIFKQIVEYNTVAKQYFDRMPHIDQARTHALWLSYKDLPYNETDFDRLASSALFQKTEYRSTSAGHPIPGSFADVMTKMY